jgi:hypothetical protein
LHFFARLPDFTLYRRLFVAHWLLRAMLHGLWLLGANFRHRCVIGLMLNLRRRFFGFALHLQPVFLQLLRVDRLFRAALLCLSLIRLSVLRPAFTAIRTISAIATATATATATAATIAAPAARLIAFLPRRTIAIAFLGSGVGGLPLLHGWPWLLLLWARVALLIGTPLALRTITLRTLRLRLVSLLRNFRIRSIAVRPVRPRLLLLRRALVAPRLLVAPCIAIAALLVRPAAASVTLLVARAVATSATSITSATSTASAALAAAMLVPVARFVVATLGALRPGGMHAGLVCC